MCFWLQPWSQRGMIQLALHPGHLRFRNFTVWPPPDTQSYLLHWTERGLFAREDQSAGEWAVKQSGWGNPRICPHESTSTTCRKNDKQYVRGSNLCCVLCCEPILPLGMIMSWNTHHGLIFSRLKCHVLSFSDCSKNNNWIARKPQLSWPADSPDVKANTRDNLFVLKPCITTLNAPVAP